jgi:8-oxo-dGTP pyrophosphatase MutT (NUDIX family)
LISEAKVENLTHFLNPVLREQNANSAVALLLRKNGEHYEILLVKRAIRLTDPWSGQIALPGGKREPKDPNLKATIIRETKEETNLSIENSRFLGVLEAVQSAPRRNLCILPFVIVLNYDQEIKLNKTELDSYIWIQFEGLSNNRITSIEPGFGEVPAYKFENAIVWGITYKIISDFSRILEKSYPMQ